MGSVSSSDKTHISIYGKDVFFDLRQQQFDRSSFSDTQYKLRQPYRLQWLRRAVDAFAGLRQKVGFDCVAQRMPKVQNLAQSLLGWVLRYDALLYRYGMGNQRGPVLLVEIAPTNFIPHGRIGNQAVLDHFGKTRPQFALGQCCQKSRVNQVPCWVAETRQCDF